ncbi:hypothetical protein [Nonomuraea recticatena]|uniref:hypothetical protein n=1 Tax=Nonomuraea recticatena TaxID=46178 RepID=UPI00360E2078
MIRWRDPRAPLAVAAATGVAGLAAALLAGAPALATGAVAGGIAALLAALSLLLASVRTAPAHRPAARWLGSGAVVWLLGVVLRPVAEGSSLVVNFADLLVLVSIVLLAGGCVLAAGRPCTPAPCCAISPTPTCAPPPCS